MRWAILTKLPVALSGEMALNSTGSPNTLHLAVEGLAVERVYSEGDRLANAYFGQLGLFEVGNHPVLRRNQRGQMGSGMTRQDAPRSAPAGRRWGDNLGILVDLRQLKRRFGAGHVGLQRIAIDDGRFTVTARHLQRRFACSISAAPCAALARAESRSRIDSEPSAVNCWMRF